MIGYLRERTVNQRVIDRLERLRHRNTAFAYCSIAKAFADEVTEQDFAAFMRSELTPPDLTHSTIHETILKIGFRGIFTTNFDRVFESQPSRPERVLAYPACLNDANEFQRQSCFFAKINGCVTNPYPGQLVITRSQKRNCIETPNLSRTSRRKFRRSLGSSAVRRRVAASAG